MSLSSTSQTNMSSGCVKNRESWLVGAHAAIVGIYICIITTYGKLLFEDVFLYFNIAGSKAYLLEFSLFVLLRGQYRYDH